MHKYTMYIWLIKLEQINIDILCCQITLLAVVKTRHIFFHLYIFVGYKYKQNLKDTIVDLNGLHILNLATFVCLMDFEYNRCVRWAVADGWC